MPAGGTSADEVAKGILGFVIGSMLFVLPAALLAVLVGAVAVATNAGVGLAVGGVVAVVLGALLVVRRLRSRRDGIVPRSPTSFGASITQWRHGGVRPLAVTLFVVAFALIVFGVIVAAFG